MALSAALPMLFVYPAMSNLIHRQIMHVPQDGEVKVARNDSSLVWFIGTAYMRGCRNAGTGCITSIFTATTICLYLQISSGARGVSPRRKTSRKWRVKDSQWTPGPGLLVHATLAGRCSLKEQLVRQCSCYVRKDPGLGTRAFLTLHFFVIRIHSENSLFRYYFY